MKLTSADDWVVMVDHNTIKNEVHYVALIAYSVSNNEYEVYEDVLRIVIDREGEIKEAAPIGNTEAKYAWENHFKNQCEQAEFKELFQHMTKLNERNPEEIKINIIAIRQRYKRLWITFCIEDQEELIFSFSDGEINVETFKGKELAMEVDELTTKKIIIEKIEDHPKIRLKKLFH